MKKLVNGKYIELNAEEITAMQREQERAAVEERKRPMTESEVTKMIITEHINSISVDDQTALRMRDYYPEWETDREYKVGHKVQYGGELYKIVTAHTSQADWTPDVSVTVFERIDETHDGSKYDPIPYEGNMVLENGKYYVQDGVTYVGTRNSENPVYHALKDLVGLYVDAV